MKKRLLSLLLVFAMLLTLLPLSALAEEPREDAAEPEETATAEDARPEAEPKQAEAPKTYLVNDAQAGSCGDNVTWTLTDDGILTISGSGKMKDYGFDAPPWSSQKSSIRTVIIESGVTSVGWFSFSTCPNLEAVFLPSSVTTIGQSAFYSCAKLASVTIPPSVTTIGANAFNSCGKLTSIFIPASVKKIEANAFAFCENLASVSFASSSTTLTLGQGTFMGCRALTSAALPSSVNTIPYQCFSECSRLTSVIIPASVSSIGEEAFRSCDLLGAVFYEGTEKGWALVSKGSHNGPLDTAIIRYDYDTGNLAAGFCNDALTWTLSRNGVFTLSGTGKMKVINPDNPNFITLEYFPWYSFREQIKTVVIEDGVTNIQGSSFFGSNLEAVYIPASVTSISSYAFSGVKNVYYAGTEADWQKTGGSDVPQDATITCNCGFFGKNLFWQWTADGTLSISGTGAMPDYSILSNPAPWSYLQNNIQSVTIANGITSIGSDAFDNCAGLTSVSIPNSVAAIDGYAFRGCSALNTIFLPDSVSFIGEDAFAYCSSLRSLTIPSHVISIGMGAFMGCTGLTSISVPDAVSSISAYSFCNCTSLTQVCIPLSVNSVGAYAFDGCSALKNVFYAGTADDWNSISISSIGNSPLTNAARTYNAIDGGTFGSGLSWSLNSSYDLTISGAGAMPDFSGSMSLPWYNYLSQIHTVDIGPSITSIGNYSFYNCRSLTSVFIPDSVRSIGSSAFSYCTSLTSVSIPYGVTSIGSYAFRSCTGLTSVSLPPSVKNIGNYAFNSCSSLKDVNFAGTKTDWSGVTKGSGNEPLTGAIIHFLLDHGFCGQSCQWTLTDDGVLTISGSGSTDDYDVSDPPWYGNSAYVKSIVIEHGITAIGDFAFYNCSNAKSALLPSTVNSIGNRSFSGCSSLTQVILSSSVKNIDDLAFYNSNSTFVIYGAPGSASQTFADRQRLTFMPGGSCGDNVYWLLNTSGYRLTILGTGAMSDYSTNPRTGSDNTPWTGYKASLSSVTVQPGVTNIGNNSFLSCSSITSVSLADTITSIGSSAFKECEKLPSISIPASVTDIGSQAFFGCSRLKSIEIPYSVTSIHRSAFSSCTALTEIKAVYTNPKYSSADGVLYNKSQTELVCCPAGKSGVLIVPAGTGIIGEDAFYGCSKLTSVILPYGATKIGNSAFANCTSLTITEIPASVTTIGTSAYYSCAALKDVFYRGSSEIDAGDYNEPLTNATQHFCPIGDVYRDDTRSLKDVSVLFAWWNGKTTTSYGKLCDANGDGTVDLRDVALIYRLVSLSYY